MEGNRFTRAVGGSEGGEGSDKGYQALQAFSGNRRSPRFEVILETGEMYGFSYSYLSEWVFHPRGFLSFSTGHNVITVEGRGLEKLHQLLRDEKLSGIQVFKEGEDEEPAADAPKVTKVHIKPRFDTDLSNYDS